MTPTHSPFSLSFSPSLCLRCVAAASPCRSLRHCACAASARQGRQDLKAALRTMQENLSARHGEAQASLEDSHTRALAAQQDSHQRDLVALEDRHRQVPPPCLETGRMQASRRTNHAHHSFHPPPGRSCWPSRHSTGTRCGASTPPRCGAAPHVPPHDIYLHFKYFEVYVSREKHSSSPYCTLQDQVVEVETRHRQQAAVLAAAHDGEKRALADDFARRLAAVADERDGLQVRSYLGLIKAPI